MKNPPIYNIQIHKLSKKVKEKLLKQQNEIRKKYGLRPLKRLHIETFYKPSNDTEHKAKKHIPNYGGMYQ